MPNPIQRPMTAEEWRRALEQWQRSGLSIADFARRIGVQPTAMHYWKKKLGVLPSAAPAPPTPTLLPVELTPSPSTEAPVGAARMFELVLPGGCIVRVPQQYDAAALLRLVRMLREAAC